MILTPHLKKFRRNGELQNEKSLRNTTGLSLPKVTLTLFQGTYIYKFHCVPPSTATPVHRTVPQHEEATNSQRQERRETSCLGGAEGLH